MHTVRFFTADGRKAGEETFPTRRAACTAARQFVTRDGLNSYQTATRGGKTTYSHSYGEREAVVKEEGA